MTRAGRQGRHDRRNARLAFVLGSIALLACSKSSNGPAMGGHDGAGVDAVARRDAREASATGKVDSAPPGSCRITAPTPPDWRLSANGQLLQDGLGRTVFLRGVNGGGRSKLAPYLPFDFADGGYATALDAYMSHAEEWGIDVMRVPFTWAALEPTEGQNDATWQAMYGQLLASAWSHGIWVVLDFHQDVFSDVFCGDGFPAWTVPDAGPPMQDCINWGGEYFTDMAVEDAFDTFWASTTGLQPKYLSAWKTMITAFADTPGVLGFEMFNEPSGGTAAMATFESTTLTQFFTMVGGFMRGLAPTSLVFADVTGIDGATVETALLNPNVPGLVFAPHFYPISPGDTAATEASLTAWADIGKSWNVPVFLGEFGASNTLPGTPGYISSVWNAVDALGFAGATEWEYSVSTELWNSETDSIATPDGGEYPVAASIIRPYARAVAGADVTQSWDAASQTFTLSYTATGGGADVTEIRVPARAFAGDAAASMVVSVTGGCYDQTGVKGEVLVQASSGSAVTVTIRP
jgi:endoglycosylceramidase